MGKRKRAFFQSLSSNSASICRFRCRRADFLIARRSAATACFSAWRSRRVRLSVDFGKCVIFGRWAPTFGSVGLAYGSIAKSTFFKSRQRDSGIAVVGDRRLQLADKIAVTAA
jgi:hypothetical protein